MWRITLALSIPWAVDASLQEVKMGVLPFPSRRNVLPGKGHHLQDLCHAVHSVAREEKVGENEPSFCSADELDVFGTKTLP